MAQFLRSRNTFVGAAIERVLESSWKLFTDTEKDLLRSWARKRRWRSNLPASILSAGSMDFADKKVLDCGCGTGYSLAHIASLFPTADYVGIDADQGAIDYAVNRYPSMEYVVMNALDIKFPAASFDIVLSFEVLEHLTRPEQETYVSEMSRVLRPGGTLVLSTPNRDVFSLGYTESLNPYHLSELTLPEMRRLLDAHFQDPTIYGQFFANVAAREKDFAQLRNQVHHLEADQAPHRRNVTAVGNRRFHIHQI